MIIATLKEVKNNENRVALTPAGVKQLRKHKHRVIVQKNAGVNAGFADSDYKKAGAAIISSPIEIAKKADIIIKVKEPIKKEFSWLRNFKGKILFTFLHLAAAPKALTPELLKNKIAGVAYETVEDKGKLPLLKPMSEIAGVLAIEYGAEYLQKKYGGRGITLGFVEKTHEAEVVIVGGGNVGTLALLTAAGMGSNITLLEKNSKRITFLKKFTKHIIGPHLMKHVKIMKSTPKNLETSVKKADLLVGAVLVPGARAPVVVTRKMVKSMKKGAVIVDVAIDQGGCIYGSKPTTHSKPIYKSDGKIYCCITNMPGQAALQSTEALTSATLPYLVKLADKGLKAFSDKGFAKGVNTFDGKIACKPVAQALKLTNNCKEFIF